VVVGTVASFVVALLATLVWHTRSPNAADAEMMRWQEVARVRGDGVATAIAVAVGPLVALAVLAGVALAWRVKRWDAVVLVLVAAPGSLVVELLLKQGVHRQRPDGGAALLYPSGHVATMTAAAVATVLVLRVTPTSRRVWVPAAWLAGGLVVLVAAARLVQTVHYFTDIVGGAALGLAFTCWAVLAITVVHRSGPLGMARSRPSRTRQRPSARRSRASPETPGQQSS
jgi:undecaprenyl-diphosphatase